ncbi:Mor transcription activator family protein [Nitrosomonas sp. Nm166]|uniref:Mor transcription activator family protein n=1 Tax=Nitrosomonas sp. Nm166 TaxID=1881054 RepID=UPI0008E3BC80|nr:Mor transcription activator family protein [Nitrosomonas sp. Nm166]SFF05343.1 Mor transcription activator family protein [Nitrosomonas sp. Nm166]
MNQAIDTSLLPGILQEMVELIGQAATLKLVAKYGGVRIYVPKVLGYDHPLVETVGMVEASALVARYQGEVLEIPRAVSLNVAQRNAAIKQEYQDLSQRQLALKYGLIPILFRNSINNPIPSGNAAHSFLV